MLENHSETVGNERVMTLRRKLLHGALVLVLALTMLTAIAPRADAADMSTDFATISTTSTGYGGGWGGWCCVCPECTIYNHNETLVEDDRED